MRLGQSTKLGNRLNSIYFSVILFLILFFPPIAEITVNHAKVINQCSYASCNIFATTYEKTLPYTFSIANKLVGTGAIELTIDKKLIKGIATGKGMACQCEIDFLTNIDGAIANSGIDVSVSGVGDPIGIPLPGKVKFHGPLRGFFKNDKLSLTGKVTINGGLARAGGFRDTEDIVIEIDSDPILSKTFKEIQKQEKLASL